MFNGVGEVVGHTVTREPEWSPEDVRMVLAQMLYEQSLGPHGWPMDEAMSQEGNLNNPKGSYWWRLDDPDGRIDLVEKTIRDAEEKFRERYPNESMNGRVFTVSKVPRVPR